MNLKIVPYNEKETYNMPTYTNKVQTLYRQTRYSYTIRISYGTPLS